MTLDSVASGGESVLTNVIITTDCTVYKGRVYIYVPKLSMWILNPRKEGVRTNAVTEDSVSTKEE